MYGLAVMSRPLTDLEAVLAERWAYEYLQGRDGAFEDLRDYVPDFKTSGLTDVWYLRVAARALTLPSEDLRNARRLKLVSQVLGWPLLYALTVASADLRPSLAGWFEIQARVALSDLKDPILEQYARSYAEIGGETLTVSDIRRAISEAGSAVTPGSFEERVLAIQTQVRNGDFRGAAAAVVRFRADVGRTAPGNLRRAIFALGLEQADFDPLLAHLRAFSDEPLRSKDISAILHSAKNRSLNHNQLETIIEFIMATAPDSHLAVDASWFFSRNNMKDELVAYMWNLSPELLGSSWVSASLPSILARHGTSALHAAFASRDATAMKTEHIQILLMTSITVRDEDLMRKLLAVDQAVNSTQVVTPLLVALRYVATTMLDELPPPGWREDSLSAWETLPEDAAVQLILRLPSNDHHYTMEIMRRRPVSIDERAACVYYFAHSGQRKEAHKLLKDIWPKRLEIRLFLYRYLAGAAHLLNDLDLTVEVFRDVLEDELLDGERLARLTGGTLKALTDRGRTGEAEELLWLAMPLIESAPPESQAILFNLLVAGYAGEKRLEDAMRIKETMIDRGVPVDRFTLGALSSAMYRSGMLSTEEGQIRGASADEWRTLAILFDDVVHELNQPVGRAGMALRTLMNARSSGHAELEDTALEALSESIRDLGDRLGVYKGLTGSASTGGRVDVDEIIGQVVGMTRRFAQATGIEVEHVSGRRDDNPIQILGDAFQLRLALRALVVNAIQAMVDVEDSNRRVLVSTMISHVQATDLVEIYVRDNGPGIPEVAREKIFTRGYTTKPGRGLGLGLSLVQSVVENHGGSITLQDDVDSGTEFWIRLPAYRTE